MTSAWKEPPGRIDSAEGQGVAPDEDQLELFKAPPSAGAQTVLPPEADLTGDSAHHEDGRAADMTATEASTDDVLDVRRADSDSDELRRLEDSIRWLMNESSMRRMPRAATLQTVRGLPPVESFDENDTLLLDPDTLLNPDNLFPSQSPRRRSGSIARGAAKMLLVSAVAAPTAYFIADWMQFPWSAAPTDAVTMSDSASISSSAAIAGLPDEQIASVAPPQMSQPPQAQTRDDVSSAPQPIAERGIPPVEAAPPAAADAGSAAADTKGAPEQSREIAAAPSDPAPSAEGPRGAQSSSPSTPAAAPSKPAQKTEDTALLLQRGRVLFEAGDIAAARLFFRRAANAGDAAAAVAMGATYDPDVLGKRFIRGIEADPQEARMWYEKARALGSPEGPRRIEMLAQRQAQ